MKKGWKIALISLGSLVGLLAVVVGVVCWVVLTPARLTGVVNRLSDRFVDCDARFERVDLTLFKTFPNVGLDVHDVLLLNAVEGAPSDTLARIGSLAVGVDARAFLRRGDIVVRRVRLDDVSANLFVSPDGVANYDIFPSSDTTQADTTSSFSLPDTVLLEKISVRDLRCRYDDRQQGLQAAADGLQLTLDGSWRRPAADARLRLEVDSLGLRMLDSVGAPSTEVAARELRFDGDAHGSYPQLEGELQLRLPSAEVSLDGQPYVPDAANESRHALLQLRLPFAADLDSMSLRLHDARLSLLQYAIELAGSLRLPADERPMDVDLAFQTGRWQVAPLLALLPFPVLPDGMSADAQLELSGTARGPVGDSLLPCVDARLQLADGSFRAPSLLPFDVRRIKADVDASLDLAMARPSNLVVHSLEATAQHNTVQLDGTVDDLLGACRAALRLRGNLRLPELQPFLPDSLPLDVDGRAALDLRLRGTLDDVRDVALEKLYAVGTLRLTDLDVVYDSLSASSPALNVALDMDPARRGRLTGQLMAARLTGGRLQARLPQQNVEANLSDLDLDVALTNPVDARTPLALDCNFSLGSVEGGMDSLQARLEAPGGRFAMRPRADNPARVRYEVDFHNAALRLDMGDSLSLDLSGLAVKGEADYDSTRGNVLQQWSPNLDVDFKLGHLTVPDLPYVVQVPDIKFNYRPERCEIASANVVFGGSDFYLSGAVTGLERWLSHEDMLRGDLYFTSNYTNVDDLLEVFSGMGSDPDTLQAQRVEDSVPREANPFIVPRDVDVTLHTRVKEALAFGNELQELAGDVTVCDGVAVLDQVGFVCKAARMQLTGMYRTPRVNHLYAGLDFHLLDIEISELIDMIPMVDTLVPMLASLDGHANFHLAVETNLDAFYRPKMSTLLGSAAIVGDSLVVLDNETFDKIAKLMMFKKSTRNVIDSLDVELTVFRREVTVYPFLLSMDKYQVVATGRHDLDNNYDYHLEVVQSPLPARVAVDVLGTMPKLGFRVGKCRYADLYRPERAGRLEQQTMAMKQSIRKALESSVRQSTRTYEGLDAETKEL
ncbi:MAG: DUF748 domain-containing protein [Bacteroidales bacterium]|nr:DUF748 domain-containing protein [Bacteroidales bacterium]